MGGAHNGISLIKYQETCQMNFCTDLSRLDCSVLSVSMHLAGDMRFVSLYVY